MIACIAYIKNPKLDFSSVNSMFEAISHFSFLDIVDFHEGFFGTTKNCKFSFTKLMLSAFCEQKKIFDFILRKEIHQLKLLYPISYNVQIVFGPDMVQANK